MKRIRDVQLLAGLLVGGLIFGWILTSRHAQAHCDTMDGPVVQAARSALDRKNLTPVLKWINADDEEEVMHVFQAVLKVREKGPEVRSVADRLFFETVVRFHRQAEGEPFQGLEPAGTDPGPVIRGVDQALGSGAVDPLVKVITDQVVTGLRIRFEKTRWLQVTAEKDVEAGRAYVESYVQFVHYADELHRLASRPLALHGPYPAPEIENREPK